VGLSFHGSFLRMGVMVAESGETQGAAVVSRRVGSAVIRNRVKRCLREIFRQQLPLLKNGLWLVITAKPAAAAASSEAILSEWLRLGRRLSIFADS
jgi:ribonuclease P protein component